MNKATVENRNKKPINKAKQLQPMTATAHIASKNTCGAAALHFFWRRREAKVIDYDRLRTLKSYKLQTSWLCRFESWLCRFESWLCGLKAGFAHLKAGFAQLKAGFADLKAGFADLKAGFVDLKAGFVD
jgi:hypothetical protein